MHPLNSKEIGQLAEQEACRLLTAKGFKLLAKNYQCYVGEIDLIMRDQDDIVFVEVRYRSREDYGSALESVNQSKMNKLIRAATQFLQKKGWLYKVNSRFDVVVMTLIAGKPQLEWFKNAFTVERY